MSLPAEPPTVTTAVSGGPSLYEGLKVRGCGSRTDYQVAEGWPRRGDLSGEVFRATARDIIDGQEFLVALKVSRGQPVGGHNATAADRAWSQEVRLLRRLALLTYGTLHKSVEGTEQPITQHADTSSGDGPFTIQLLSEFGGVKTLPSLRFMATMPCCWRSMDTRIKATQSGGMEKYSESQALRWAYQLARGLWALQEADISFISFSLHHVLLTAPDGDVRLSGFDLHAYEPTSNEWDSRDLTWDLARVLHMLFSCSTDREDDQDYYKRMRRSSRPSIMRFLQHIPKSMQPTVLDLLIIPGREALPLGLALDQIQKAAEVDSTYDAPGRRELRPLEQQHWQLVQMVRRERKELAKKEHNPNGPGKDQSSIGDELAKVTLALGKEWEKRSKAYKALELYKDLSGGYLRSIDVAHVAEALSRQVDLYQNRGESASAVEAGKTLVEVWQKRVQEARDRVAFAVDESEEDAEGSQAQQLTPDKQKRGDRIPLLDGSPSSAQKLLGAIEQLVNARVKLALSLRTSGELRPAIAQLNTAQAELQETGDVQSLAAVRVLMGKASLYSQRKDYPQALDMFEEALERRRRVVTRNDPELACLLVSIAGVYAEKGDTDVALEMLIGAYKKMSEIFPQREAEGSDVAIPDNLIMSNALERIGQLFSKKAQHDDALMCFKAAHERRAASLPRAHPDVASILSQMAQAQERRGDYRQAAVLHGKALEIRRASLAPSAPEIAASLYGLGNAHQRLKSSKSALAAYLEAESIRRPYGPSIALGDILVNLSRPLRALGKEADAIEKLQEAREVYLAAHLPVTDQRVITIDENLEAIRGAAATSVSVLIHQVPESVSVERCSKTSVAHSGHLKGKSTAKPEPRKTLRANRKERMLTEGNVKKERSTRAKSAPVLPSWASRSETGPVGGHSRRHSEGRCVMM